MSMSFETTYEATAGAERGADVARVPLTLTCTADADVTPAGPPHQEGDPRS